MWFRSASREVLARSLVGIQSYANMGLYHVDELPCVLTGDETSVCEYLSFIYFVSGIIAYKISELGSKC